MAIKIYYVVCPNITTNFAHFPETPTGKELTAIIYADGECVPNAVAVEKPRLLCKGDGNWTLPSGGCECMAGYEPFGQTCQGRNYVHIKRVHSSVAHLHAQCASLCAAAPQEGLAVSEKLWRKIMA